jgi:hypothetical protein
MAIQPITQGLFQAGVGLVLGALNDVMSVGISTIGLDAVEGIVTPELPGGCPVSGQAGVIPFPIKGKRANRDGRTAPLS